MSDNISSEHYRAEISMLNREVARLNREIEKASVSQETKRSKFDPFDNPAEYTDFREDYSAILPQIEEPGYKPSLEPASAERKKLRFFYNTGSIFILLQFIIGIVGVNLLLLAAEVALGTYNKDASDSEILTYIRGSSIFIGINTIVYSVSNVLFGYLGLKTTSTDTVPIVRTKDFSFGTAVYYCICSLALWFFGISASSLVSDIFSKYGLHSGSGDSKGFAVTAMGFAVMTIYTCVIAPITEEFFFRGMVLRVFSKSNQRFGVFASAFFFGLSHGNFPQAVMAFPMGIFLAHITLKHGSVVPSVIVHIFINSLSTVLGLIKPMLNDTSGIVVNIIFLAFVFVGAFFLIIFRSKDKLPASTPEQSRRGIALAEQSFLFLFCIFIETAYIIYVMWNS